jgi:hypothetical protein
MGHKNQTILTFNWQSSNPQTGFNPTPYNGAGSTPSGTEGGTMSSTNTIYSNIIEVSRMDNHGIEVAWTGTPTGTLTILVSNSGLNWPALTFDPVLTQPVGSANSIAINLNQLPFKYVMLKYINASGSGTLKAYTQLKDLN